MVDPCLVTWQFFIPSGTSRARSTRGDFQSCSYILFLKNKIKWDTEIVKMLSTSGAENIQAISLNYMSNMMFTSNDTSRNDIYICVYIPGKLGFCSHHYCAIYDECKYSDTLWPADRIRLFVHYTISLSLLCKLICRHWTYEMSARYILSSVWVRLSMFS